MEHPFPQQQIDHQQLLDLKNRLNLKVALVNIQTDAESKFGCASLPHKQEDFRKNFEDTVKFAKLFDCKKIHLMSGKLDHGPTKEHHQTFVSNLKYASEILEQEDMLGVIEPINHLSVPGYFLHDYKYAVQTIKSVGSNNIKLMVDLFHLQLIQGNIVNSLKEFQPLIGHVQVAQAPNRNEPNAAGEINLKYVLQELEKIGYNDFIGCEYKPMTTTGEGLGWITEFGYQI